MLCQQLKCESVHVRGEEDQLGLPAISSLSKIQLKVPRRPRQSIFISRRKRRLEKETWRVGSGVVVRPWQDLAASAAKVFANDALLKVSGQRRHQPLFSHSGHWSGRSCDTSCYLSHKLWLHFDKIEQDLLRFQRILCDEQL